jgi:hypothetical protein
MLVPMPENTPEKGPIGTRTACAILGIERKTIFRWTDAGILPTLGRLHDGPGGAFVYDVEVVRELRRQLDVLAALPPAELAAVVELGRAQAAGQ